MPDKENSSRSVREKAVALQYDDPNDLPRVTASGCGEIAKRIIAIAEEHGVPIQRSDALAELLSTVRHGDEIPPESYALAAEVISFLYHVDKAWRESHQFLEPLIGPVNSKQGGA